MSDLMKTLRLTITVSATLDGVTVFRRKPMSLGARMSFLKPHVLFGVDTSEMVTDVCDRLLSKLRRLEARNARVRRNGSPS